jgi:hypothetical protein
LLHQRCWSIGLQRWIIPTIFILNLSLLGRTIVPAMMHAGKRGKWIVELLNCRQTGNVLVQQIRHPIYNDLLLAPGLLVVRFSHDGPEANPFLEASRKLGDVDYGATCEAGVDGHQSNP